MVFGKGLKDGYLSEEVINALIKKAFQKTDFSGKKVLIIIPDHTRTAPIDLFFKAIFNEIGSVTRKLDYIIALGTHRALSDEEIYRRVGITGDERKSIYQSVTFYNHQWDNPDSLKTIGRISSDEIKEITNGILEESVQVTINKVIFEYDQLLVIGPVFPHEVVGFSGGNKYFFPGISGPELTNLFHWLGALITNLRIIGIKNTLVRDVLDRAAQFIDVPRLCFSLVVRGEKLSGLYFGSPEESWSRAADLSSHVNIVYRKRRFQNVLSMPSEMYDDLWTAAKAMYKLEPVVAEGGTLIIYAPWIKEVSYTHGRLIDKVGYHVRDFFLKQPGEYDQVPGIIKAHSTHVKGAGTYENRVEKPRINVILATGIPEERCHRINVGYVNPDSINISDWMKREDQGILFVQNAGEVLYRFQ
ncbi:MAG: lactate racemase domain-containing protein [Fidelibacterota bacterium]